MKKEIPLLYGSPKDKALFDPEHFLSSVKIKHPKADIAVIYFSSKIDKIVKEKLKIKPVKRNYEKMQFAHKKINGREVLFLRSGIGGAASGAAIEELISLGAKKIFFVGAAGTLLPLDIGSIMLPTKAIRDEGTSYHYLKPGKYSYPNKELFSKVQGFLKKEKIEYKKGITWTTDAPYRETFKKIEKYKSEGTISVEMEAATLFAIGKYRKVQIVGLFWVSDQLLEKWNPQFRSENETKGIENAFKIILDLVKDESKCG